MNQFLTEKQEKNKLQITSIVKELHDLTISIEHKELSQTLSDLRSRINDPFMFVVVGEVKAGKSSFINALLGQDICGVAPQPFTDTIQQISYGETEVTQNINSFFRKIKLPIDILKDIAIVDTPGTNAIITHHQELTERFVPSSDLIVFVFEAKNPYRQSSWAFFDFIQDEWKKKIIFVLQQKDLLPKEDLLINEQGVRDYAIKKGIVVPEIFSVSAKMELDGHIIDSGFDKIRTFVKDKITGGKAVDLKLISNINIAENINNRLIGAIGLRRNQFELDLLFRKKITDSLSQQEDKSLQQVARMVDNLIAGYDQICYKTEEKIRAELGLFSMLKRSISAVFGKKNSLKNWFDDLGQQFSTDINTTLQSKLNEGVFDVADSINQMLTIIDTKIEQSETILKNDHQFFSEIAEKRNSILKDLKATFQSFVSDTQNFTGDEAFGDSKNLAPNIAKGSGIAVIGIVLSTLTNVMLIDITGGILSAVGILFAGISLGLNKSKVISGFKKETNTGRLKLKEEITNKLTSYIKELRLKIDGNFSNFDQMLENEITILNQLEQKVSDINLQLNTMSKDLNIQE